MKIFDKIKFGAVLILSVAVLCALGFNIKNMQDRRAEAAAVVVSLHIPNVDPDYPCDDLRKVAIRGDVRCAARIDSADTLKEIDGILLRNGFTLLGAATYTRGEGAGGVEAFVTANKDGGTLTINVKNS